MTLTTLLDRIANTEERISKKQNTIEKKARLILKKENMLQKLTDEDEIRWMSWDIKHLHEDIERLTKEVEENEKKLEQYKSELTDVTARENDKDEIIEALPETLKRMQAELVDEWDSYDKKRKAKLCDLYRELGYREFYKKYSHSDREFSLKSEKEIHKDNMRDAEALIINLVYRVRAITGEITDWSGIKATLGTHGFTVLNGIVEGKQGRANVESILAGGYNIQRLHVRVLVREMN